MFETLSASQLWLHLCCVSAENADELYFGWLKGFAWRRITGKIHDNDVIRMFGLAEIMDFILTPALHSATFQVFAAL